MLASSDSPPSYSVGFFFSSRLVNKIAKLVRIVKSEERASKVEFIMFSSKKRDLRRNPFCFDSSRVIWAPSDSFCCSRNHKWLVNHCDRESVEHYIVNPRSLLKGRHTVFPSLWSPRLHLEHGAPELGSVSQEKVPK